MIRCVQLLLATMLLRCVRRRGARTLPLRRRRPGAPGRSHRADAVAGWQCAGLHRQHRQPRRRQERSPTCGASATTAAARVRLTEHAEAQRIAPAVVARRQVDRVPVRPAAAKRRQTQVWLMPANGGKARRLTNFARWRRRFRLVARRQAPGADRARSRTPRRHAQAEEPAADRHRALPVQGRRRRLSRPAPQAPVRRSTSPAARPTCSPRARTTNSCRRGRPTAR